MDQWANTKLSIKLYETHQQNNQTKILYINYIYIYEYYKKIKTKIKMNKQYLPNYVAFFFLSSIKIKFFTWLHKSWITNLIEFKSNIQFICN